MFFLNSVKKIQKIKSLNKAIHLPSVSFSYPKQQHRGSFMLKLKQKSPLLKRRLMDLSYLIFERKTGGTIIATATRTFTATTAQLLDLSYLIGTTPASTTTTSTAYPRLLDFLYLNLNCVSNMNSKIKSKNSI